MCAQRRLKSACAIAQYDQSLRCPHAERLHSCLSKILQWRFWSDCANAQADLNLDWSNMSPKVRFLTLQLICVIGFVSWIIPGLVKVNKSFKSRICENHFQIFLRWGKGCYVGKGICLLLICTVFLLTFTYPYVFSFISLLSLLSLSPFL